jgi:translocation protein SEC63
MPPAATANVVLLVLWLVWVGLVVIASYSVKDLKPFDPFEILGVARDATDKEIRSAYRQLSLKYHPDKVGSGAQGH